MYGPLKFGMVGSGLGLFDLDYQKGQAVRGKGVTDRGLGFSRCGFQTPVTAEQCVLER